MTIQWYPGHMVKAKKNIKEILKLIDVVIEIIDARIPQSSRNPELTSLIGQKPQILVLNRSDLAEADKNKLWLSYFRDKNIPAVLVNSNTGEGIKNIAPTVQQAYKQYKADQGSQKIKNQLRSLVIGIPNVGKSSFINRLVGKNTAKTGNKAGVTKGNQWLKVDTNLELLDTPGILWPKFDDTNIAFNLAVTGAINDDILDFDELAFKLVNILIERNKVDLLVSRYAISHSSDPFDILNEIGAKRGCLIAGGQVDLLKVSQILIKEFRGGKLGRFTLELPTNN